MLIYYLITRPGVTCVKNVQNMHIFMHWYNKNKINENARRFSANIFSYNHDPVTSPTYISTTNVWNYLKRKTLAKILPFFFVSGGSRKYVFAFDTMEIMLSNAKVMDYLSDIYIDENPTFPSKIWTENLSSIQIMTNAYE